MLERVTDKDLPEVRVLIAAALRQGVARSDAEARFLIDDIEASLAWWRENPDQAVHLKYSQAGSIAGVVLVKNFWNLTNLFVTPDRQGQGIGRLLLTEVLAMCRDKSPRSALLLNSSTVAVGFYQRMGFTQTGPGKDRPGGCVPFTYAF
jgi:GNAT superfamily N-acetyltransferase